MIIFSSIEKIRIFLSFCLIFWKIIQEPFCLIAVFERIIIIYFRKQEILLLFYLIQLNYIEVLYSSAFEVTFYPIFLSNYFDNPKAEG